MQMVTPEPMIQPLRRRRDYGEIADEIEKRLKESRIASRIVAFHDGDVVTLRLEQVRPEIPSHGGPAWYKSIRRMLKQGWGNLKIWEIHGDEASVIADHPLGILDGSVLVPLRLLRTANTKEPKMNMAKELLKVAKCMVAAPRLTSIVQQFEKVQSSISGFGATDSEPNGFFERLMGMAVSGKAFPSVNPGNWQLYSSKPGWEAAADKLTKAAKIAFDAIQNAPHVQVMELAKYYGWDVDQW